MSNFVVEELFNYYVEVFRGEGGSRLNEIQRIKSLEGKLPSHSHKCISDFVNKKIRLRKGGDKK